MYITTSAFVRKYKCLYMYVYLHIVYMFLCKLVYKHAVDGRNPALVGKYWEENSTLQIIGFYWDKHGQAIYQMAQDLQPSSVYNFTISLVGRPCSIESPKARGCA